MSELNDPEMEVRLTANWLKYDDEHAERPITAYALTLGKLRVASAAVNDALEQYKATVAAERTRYRHRIDQATKDLRQTADEALASLTEDQCR